uniref:C2H2-type domain-containing protein n=1 Tax=Anopheles culicifacies TaxID=139723 RepID=A0A182M5Y9_9DIPT
MEQEHNKGAYLKCPICNKRNLYRQHLITHIDLHNNPEKYRCEVCKEIYQNLDSHMIKAHTPTTAIPADKKYKCDQCGRMFNFLANLKMHIDCIHGSKDVRCNVCDKYFNLKAFRAHKRTAHTDQLLMCEHCPKMFKTRGALEVHKGIHDDSLVQFTACKLCNKQIRLTNVKKHMTSQHSQDGPVNCELCGKIFRTMFHMKRHQKNTCEATINSRKHKCEVCGKGFCLKLTMIEHMTTHTRTNQYQCAFCFKSFGYISNLYKHRKKAHPQEWQEVQARPEEGISSVIVLKPAANPYICIDCWNTVNEFHLFYTKLETIHNESLENASEAILDINELKDIEYLEEDTDELLQITSVKRESDKNVNYPKKSDIKCDPIELDGYRIVEIEVADDAENDDHPNDTDDEESEYEPPGTPDHRTKPVILNGRTKTNVASESSTIAIDILEPEEPVAVKRGRGRPPKRKSEQQQAYTPTEVPARIKKELNDSGASAHSTGVVKRGRGRPPKSIKQEQNATYSTPRTVKKEIASESTDEVTPERYASGRPERRSTRVRKVKRYSDMEQVTDDEDEENDDPDEEYVLGEDPDYEARLELQKQLDMDDYSFYEYQCSLESEQVARDNKIFQYVEEFACYLCSEKVTFKRFADAHLHYRVEHNQPPFLKCPKCDKKCHTPGMFVSHMETHDDPEKNKCNVCGKLNDCNISLKKHMRVHQSQLEENLPYPCSLCKRKFATEDLRAKHEKLHVPKPYVPKEKGPDQEVLEFYKTIVCDICEEETHDSPSFDNLSDLRAHMVKEHNKNMYIRCPVCSARQSNRQQVITHIDMHNNPDKYRCEICNEVHQNLHHHMLKAHTANTEQTAESAKHKCDQCGRTFTFLANLKMHIDCVHGLKDVRCNICDKLFNYRAYRAHKRTAHTDLMLMCELCPRMFKNRKSFEAHKAFHDSSLLRMTQCTLCGKQIRTCSMSKHMKTIHSEDDPVNCDLCGKMFRTPFHMKRHQKNTCEVTMDSRSFKCEVCGKGFSTKLTMTEHMTTHTRTNQYQCAFCFKSFGYISNLYKHRKKAHPQEWQEVQAHPEENIPSVIVVQN